MKASRVAILLVASGLLSGGCGRMSDRGASGEKPQMHRATPPHGGTPVPLGEDYNLELICDSGSGTLSAYVLDDEMEEFIRSPNPSITIVAKADGGRRTLILGAVANAATGETVGDTSLFQGQADWLKAAPRFEGNLVGLTVRGTHFTNISFNFPKNK
jgi:hypothetical protein